MANFLKTLFGAKQPEAVPQELEEPDATFERAEAEMEIKTAAHVELWGLDSATRWDADLEAGTLTFTNDEKHWVITAPVQVVGTFNVEKGTWLWGWDHPSVPEPLAEHARRVRAFGAQYGLEALTSRMIEATEEDGWVFTSLACHLAGAQGGYRGPAGDTRVFMTFGDVTINRGDS